MGDQPKRESDECSIKVICRVRPLNAQEERAGSKFIAKFPTDDSISMGVSLKIEQFIDISINVCTVGPQ